MKNIPPAAESTSASYGDQKEDSDSEKSFKKQNSDNDDNTKNQKRTKTKSKKANVSCDSDIELEGSIENKQVVHEYVDNKNGKQVMKKKWNILDISIQDFNKIQGVS